MTINLKSLIGKLDTPTRKAMESAANVALSRTHHEVDIEHVLLELLASSDGDLLRILKAYHIDAERLQADLLDSLDHFRTGNTRNPVLSRNILRWLESAWLAASVNDGAERLGSGYLLLALVTDEELQRLLTSSCAALKKLPGDDLRDQLPAILRQRGQRSGGKGVKKATNVAGQGEDGSEDGGEYEDGGQPIGHLHGKNTPNLDKYTIDLTALARAGKIDPVLGRDGEIRQMIDILLRRRQNNPILTGEPGVGKTAVVEGLALRIIEGDIPEVLANITLRTLDLGLLQAGASVKGEFENRLRSVIDEVKASLKPIILFIDEAHTLIGAGGSAGQNDAANLLKPALARGELRTIAATTWSEYKKYFEKDAALARRFQVVKIDEPSEDAAIQMLRGIANAMEAHHKIRILDEAVEEAVKLSSRYITGRQLPDKAISVLDTACARVGLSQASKPAAVEDVERLIQNIDREAAALKKEQDPAHDKRLADLAARRKDLEKDLATHQAAFVEQRQLVEEIIALRKALAEAPEQEIEGSAAKGKRGAKSSASANSETRKKLLATEHKLHDLHKQQPLIYECVDGASIADVISGWTGIPLGGMIADEIDTVRNLHTLLEQRVVGQTHALELIARRIQIAKANLEDPGKPKGVFLLVGPSGVGKTETALALADTLYGGERNLITINMSEYQEAHTVSGLKGSPPGYVGYGEGGVLTEAVRRKPYSVVLLDEVEKAHPDVLELFFQVFDKGLLEDAEGREVDFKNTIIILTSNVGTDLIMGAVELGVTVEGKNRQPTPEDLIELLRTSLQKAFKPAFLGRLSVIPYYPISDEIMRLIVGLKLDKVKARMFTNHGAALKYDQALVDLIVARCTEVDSGARDAEAIITNTVLTQISDQVLARMAEGLPVQSVDLKVRKDKLLVVVK